MIEVCFILPPSQALDTATTQLVGKGAEPIFSAVEFEAVPVGGLFDCLKLREKDLGRVAVVIPDGDKAANSRLRVLHSFKDNPVYARLLELRDFADNIAEHSGDVWLYSEVHPAHLREFRGCGQPRGKRGRAPLNLVV